VSQREGALQRSRPSIDDDENGNDNEKKPPITGEKFSPEELSNAL
jgi:hypothetical protein